MRTDVFHQIGLDSGALGLLGSTVHRLEHTGRYVGTALVGDDARGEYEIVVDEAGPSSVQIDLAEVGGSSRRTDDACCHGDTDDRPIYRVAVDGYVSFHVGSGGERWATVLGDPRPRGSGFDSRRLQKGDVFACTVLRPGIYSLRNVLGEHRTELVVRPVRPGEERYQPAEAVRLRLGAPPDEKGSSIEIGPAQGIVLTATGPTRVVIELDEPIDA